jgi:hypothetical protein
MAKKIAIAAGCAALVLAIALVLRARDRAWDKEGRVRLKSSDATVSFGSAPAISKLPSWVPVYAGSKPEGVYIAGSKDQTENTYSFKTSDAVPKVAAFFEEQLRAGGFTVTPALNDASGGMVNAETADKKRTVVVTVAHGQAFTQVSVMAIEKK